MERLISVIVPYYCTPKQLFQKCIDSVIIKDSKNIEIIVIDDGSPKEYQEIIRQVTNNTDVRVINAPHQGVSAARNTGIAEAKGEWITFVDSDDYVDKETLKKVSDHIDLFSGDVELFSGGLDKNGVIIRNTSFLKENYNYGKKRGDKMSIMESALSAGLLPEGYIQKFSYGSPYCKLFNRNFLISNKLRFNESVKFAEDTLFLLNVYIHANSIYYHDWYFYNYVDNEQSVTRKFRPGISGDMDVFFSQVKKLLQNNGVFSDLEKAYYLRAQLEVDRSFFLEFFHPYNKDINAPKRYKSFICKEPYKTALHKDYVPRKNIRQRVFRFLIINGYGNLYKLIRKLKKK